MLRSEKIARLKLLDEKNKRKARKSLSSFNTFIDDNYSSQWFHEVISDKLQSLIDGTLGKKKLMILVPPQHGKSTLSSINLPCFALGKYPDTNIAIASYAISLAGKFTVSCQNVIESEEYSKVFPEVSLGDGNIKRQDYFQVSGGKGSVKSVGVGGGLTGFTVDLGIIDDPFKDRKEANSKLNRDNVWDWYTDVFKTRLNNNSKQLMLFTRWHEDDLAGRILKQESDEWEVVGITAIKEELPPLKQCVNINDPRSIGEALWENKHSAKTILGVREHSPQTYNSLYQQRPSAAEGNMIKKEWFNTIKNFNENDFKFDVFIDGAYTSNTKNDPTAIMCVAYNKKQMIIVNSTTVHMQLFELLEFIPQYFQVHNLSKWRSRVWIEPKASGKSLHSMLNNDGFNCIEIPNKRVSIGKIGRVEDSAPSIQGGKVSILENNWNNNFIEECISFPNGLHDDQVDNLCYAVFEYFINLDTGGIWVED